MTYLDALLCLAIVDVGLSLVVSCYALLTLWDLQSDYLNSRACADRLNGLVLPLAGLTSILILLLTLAGSYFLALFPLGQTILIVYCQRSRSEGVFDPTVIGQRGQLKVNLQFAGGHVGYQVVAFFVLMNKLISHLEEN